MMIERAIFNNQDGDCFGLRVRNYSYNWQLSRVDTLLGFSVSRSATVRPLVPPPTITKSYEQLSEASRPMIRALRANTKSANERMRTQ